MRTWGAICKATHAENNSYVLSHLAKNTPWESGVNF